MSNKSTMLLEHHLKELKLPTFLREYDKLATQCATEGADHPDYLLRLSELELIDRHHRMVDRRIKAARFPTTKSLDTFDFLSMPSLNKALVLELARCEYIERCHNVIVVRYPQKCVNSQAVYPLSEQHGLKARERRYTAHEEGKHWE